MLVWGFFNKNLIIIVGVEGYVCFGMWKGVFEVGFVRLMCFGVLGVSEW